ncbi:ribonuclease Z [Dactylosporangium sp. NPDC005555]|uniref:ribonuclease Z n=1 Tax=Dactylosporangium sp. NPDC005555 TaxID=3154889 RepID=UPI0033AD774E
MQVRELVVLGTSSQVPTRTRNHNGYFLRWDDEGILFDPGDGTQRQMSHAGVSATDITRICVTHFHGDHCLGLPGIIQRISLDSAPHRVTAHYPASGQEFFDRLRHASVFYDVADIHPAPVDKGGLIAKSPKWELEARALDHGIDTYGYRLTEADGRRMLPEKLDQHGVTGPAVGALRRDGTVTVDGRAVTVEEVSVPRPGQRFAFVMDTRLCDGVYALADGADMLVIESTYLDADAGLAAAHGHLTAGQAARVAAECGVRTLVLTHFSQRYDDPARFHEEAANAFDGEVVVAEDLTRARVPARRP